MKTENNSLENIYEISEKTQKIRIEKRTLEFEYTDRVLPQVATWLEPYLRYVRIGW